MVRRTSARRTKRKKKFQLDRKWMLGIGGAAADALQAARDSVTSFISVEDLQQKAGVSKSVIETLSSFHALDGLPETSQMTLFG